MRNLSLFARLRHTCHASRITSQAIRNTQYPILAPLKVLRITQYVTTNRSIVREATCTE